MLPGEFAVGKVQPPHFHLESFTRRYDEEYL
jgi:hypothetical protein